VAGNGKIFIVARRAAGRVELYSARGERRSTLLPQGAGGEPAARFDRITVAENSKGASALEVSGLTARGAPFSVRFRLKRGEAIVEAAPGPGAERLRVDSPGRFVVLPDFFADDIVVDAAQVPGSSAEVPSENFLLHLTGARDAIAMCVFENREQEVKIHLGGASAERMIRGSEIEFGKKPGKIWVALLEAPQVWHSVDLKRSNVGRVTPLDWKMPFVGLWRCDFTRNDGLNDSWEMLLQEKEGGDYLKPTWFGSGEQRVRANRQHFDQAVGGLLYPCWSDPQGKGYCQPFNEKGKMEMTFIGPMVLYPINRLAATPADTFTVVDVVRNTLGVGPCQYILDVEGQKEELKGRATCSVREELREIYEKKEQKARRSDIEQFLRQGMQFVTHIRSRIDGYLEFAAKMRQACQDQKKAHPELGEPLGDLEKLLREVDLRVEAKRDLIKTPTYVASMMEDFRKNVMEYEGPDALERCKKFTEALVEIGGTQDQLVGELRWLVKNLRQKVALMLVKDPRLEEIAGAIRVAAQQVLRAPSVHEKARH
jgi:hypothetical protein